MRKTLEQHSVIWAWKWHTFHFKMLFKFAHLITMGKKLEKLCSYTTVYVFFFFFDVTYSWMYQEQHCASYTVLLSPFIIIIFSFFQRKHSSILQYVNTFGHSRYFPESDCIIFKSFGPGLSVPESLFLNKHCCIRTRWCAWVCMFLCKHLSALEKPSSAKQSEEAWGTNAERCALCSWTRTLLSTPDALYVSSTEPFLLHSTYSEAICKRFVLWHWEMAT